MSIKSRGLILIIIFLSINLLIGIYFTSPIYAQPVPGLIGYATLNGGTTGGQGGETVVVNDEISLYNALRDNQPRIVQIQGTIQLKTISRINVGSNKTIIGLEGAKITGGGLYIAFKNNIIIKNIIFEDAHDSIKSSGQKPTTDNISVFNSTNIWIDHCSFSDGKCKDSTRHDGSLDITGNSDYITVSYCYFSNHDKVSLIGGDDDDLQGRGKLKVTFHHNFFDGTNQRHPRVRFGEVHLFNNYYRKIGLYAIGVGVEASIYSEANYFERTPTKVRFFDTTALGAERDAPGYIKDIGSRPKLSNTRPEGVNWTPDTRYSYTPDPVEEVKNICLQYSGAGKPERQ